MNYCNGLFAHSASLLSKTALIDLNDGKNLTYGTLQDRIRDLASWFLKQGIMPGDSIGIHLHNSIEAVIVHMASQYIGAISCLIDPLTQPKSLKYYVDETKCRAIFTHVSKDSLSPELFSATKIIFTKELDSVMENHERKDIPPTPVPWDENKVSYIYFTSGTTSKPKGVMLTPANHKNFFRICGIYWQPVDENSRHLCFVPFSHAFGSIFLIPLALNTGAQLYILRSFHPTQVLEAIDRYDITHIYGVPSHYQQLLRLPQSHETLKKPKMAFCAAAKLEHQVMMEWKQVTGKHLNEGYGLIETTGGIIWRVGDEPRGTGHVGVIPDQDLIEVGSMDEDGKPLSKGQIGEIIVRGKSVMRGYLNNPQENQRAFIGGWFRTGDQGYISDDNHLFITGRVKDIINIAGIKISPYEVEEVLNNHPAVAQSAVVAADDKLYGEVVKAFVSKRRGASVSERELIKHASERLINFQVPKEILFLDRFPLNAMGKIDRKKLRTLINSNEQRAR
jgi:long-chain acyl-CoA synthetase